jgi:hypothetical protein
MVLPLQRIFNKNTNLLILIILITLAAFSFIMSNIIKENLN